MCVQYCGYGYISNGGSCIQAEGENLHYIATQFTSSYSYNMSTIGQFKISNGTSFLDPGNFIPTINRGFYSDSNSRLYSTSP